MFLASTRSCRRAMPTIAVIVLVLVMSCSSDDDSSASSEPADTTATTEATDAPETTTGETETTTGETETTETEATGSTEPAGEFDPYAQTLEWTECDYGECAEATVPIDYDDPSAGTTTIAMARLVATGDDPIGSLLVNPGGPGISGFPLLESFEEEAAPEILAAYDIVAFDPRGVGESNAVECLDDADLDQLNAADVDAQDQASIDAYIEMYQAQGEACLTNSPELAQHISTVEVAKDLDVMRALVGDDEISYFGFSWGTFLGTTYAALFPDKVGRMVLDGPEDPSLSEQEKDLSTLSGFQLAFDNFATNCLEGDCPLGASVDEIEQQVIAMFEAIKDEPLPTDDPERPLTRPLAFYGIAALMYNDDEWPTLADDLAAAFEGDGTPLLESADEYLERGADGYTSNRQVITAINCLDAQIAPPSGDAPTEDEFLAASSLFGEIAYDSVSIGCSEWPIHPTVTAPDYSAPGAAPIVVIGTTGDPATPFANAGKLADQLESGVLLVRDGEGHTAYFMDNPCITDAVNAYLLDGTVPEDGLECAPAPGSEPGQEVTLVALDDVVELGWTECNWDGTALTMSAEGSGLELEATTGDDGTVAGTISGAADGTMSGTAEVNEEGTLLVTGTFTGSDGTTGDASFLLDPTTCR